MPTEKPLASVKVRRRVSVGNVMTALVPANARALHGFGTPMSNNLDPITGSIYINKSDATLWIAMLGEWKMLV